MIHRGVEVIFSVLEASEVKLPALRAFVPPTHFPSGSGNLTRFWGVCRNQFFQFPHGTVFGPEMSFFWTKLASNNMFLSFLAKIWASGPKKKAILGQNRDYAKVHFSQKHILKFSLNRTKMTVKDHYL